jgi:hypothetical protein
MQVARRGGARSPLAITLLLGGMLLGGTLPGGTALGQVPEGGDATWRPEVSEQLIKLPAAVLDRRIDRDFQESSLGRAFREREEELRLKSRTLAELQAASELASGEQALELSHRLLVEKQAFIQLAGEKNQIERDQLATKRRVLETILSRLGQENGAMSADRRELVERQQEARQRLEASIGMADQLLSTNPVAGESRYAGRYAENIAAIEALRHKIAQHPMNQDPMIDGEQLAKPDYVRHLIAATEGAMALLAMEDEMLGYMARLTALDALALGEAMDDPEHADSDVPSGGSALQDAIAIFLN